MVPSHRPVGSADGPALFPVYGWDFSEWSLEETLGWLLDLRVAAGASPAAKATLYEGEPRWFPLIARAASPQALLSFRYTVWIFLSSHSRPCLGDLVQPVLRPEQVRPPRRRFMRGNPRWRVAAGASPAAKAMLVS